MAAFQRVALDIVNVVESVMRRRRRPFAVDGVEWVGVVVDGNELVISVISSALVVLLVLVVPIAPTDLARDRTGRERGKVEGTLLKYGDPLGKARKFRATPGLGASQCWLR